MVVGHVTLDRVGSTVRPGGSAAYAAITAHRLGLSVGVLTSHGDDFPLEALPSQIEVVTVPAPATTTFEHGDEEGQRTLALRARARPLGAADVPDDWADAALVLLAPVIDEVDPLVVTRFSDATIGAAVQGWLRAFDRDGRVSPRPWEAPEVLLARAQAIFLSATDVQGDEARALPWFERVPVGVLTAGPAGALLFVDGQRYELPVRAVDPVDATGAGDVFAATFLIRSHLGDDPWDAARAASCAATLTVTGPGWSEVPDGSRLDAAVTHWRALESD